MWGKYPTWGTFPTYHSYDRWGFIVSQLQLRNVCKRDVSEHRVDVR